MRKILNDLVMLCQYAGGMTPLQPLPNRPTPAHPPVKGFTLIELSIVLVIIALIVGGIMVGRDLIAAAQMRAVISQVEKYKTAVMTFKEKYNCLPGDCSQATQYWPADPECGIWNTASIGMACNGNGDGIIAGKSYSNPANEYKMNFDEVFGVWNQLALAGLIPGGYTSGRMCGGATIASPISNLASCPHNNIANVPASYGNSAVELMYTDNGMRGAVAGVTNAAHTFVISGPPAGGWAITIPLGGDGRAFSSNQTYYIDSKLDDGLPYSGRMTASWDQYGDYCGKSASGVNMYTMKNAVQSPYSASIPYAGCALFLSAGF
ncbi:type II secretion system protein [Singulisphaera acidiphila]|nr:prepilin-type N-terminal cleavage/methylation domain-containing protein [Singulisphaera acidiphila]